jgi:hypothetical protein
MATDQRTEPAEAQRLVEDARREKNWKRWGPYLSERQWGTVREDYSAHGNPWEYFPHDHARGRAYRWGEDGLLGIADRQCRLCFALALWNARDPILKERLFGLTGPQGNHAEDVKECYFYLDSTPTHSYMKALYKYPQSEFPYQQLLEENARRGKHDPEFELIDTGIFDENRYFDVFAEYAKNSPNDILIRITVANRGPNAAAVHLLPTVWFRNTWSWGCKYEGCWRKPQLKRVSDGKIQAEHVTLGKVFLEVEPLEGKEHPNLLFTENETNFADLFGQENRGPYVKDSFHRCVIHKQTDAVNPKGVGTKAAAHYYLELGAGQQTVVRLRLYAEDEAPKEMFGGAFDKIFEQRINEANEFYGAIAPKGSPNEEKRIARQAYAGLAWTKQFYHYVVKDWLEGDSEMPTPPAERKHGRNHDWAQLFNRDVISMPDKWEFPWYASWDLAFHMIPFAKIDPAFAKQQLILFLREWYMHPNGQIPAYEFAFSDVNPPVHAWACWRVYEMTKQDGKGDTAFLERVFHKLLLNFTWWVNRKDLEGNHIFAGGFLGMDNIGVFDRSQALPTGGHLEQADGTAWMAFYCATMLKIALELARERPTYEDVASKFFEHFVAIADAMNTLDGSGLWDEEDGFYYSRIDVNGHHIPVKVRSMVGLVPLFAADILEQRLIDDLPGFKKRMEWFLENRKDLAKHIAYCETTEEESRAHRLLAIPSRERLERALRYMLDENEFLSPFGIRSLSRHYREQPFVFQVNGTDYRVAYDPGESTSGMFGGNSNWRGPVWFPTNYLLIESLETYHHFYGDRLKVEFPTGSGEKKNLREIACELHARLTRIFLPDENGRRPCFGDDARFASDEHWRNLLWFHEYFHGDNGRGCGASHQTGWTALVASCLEKLAEKP